jgi:hypothetical protein
MLLLTDSPSPTDYPGVDFPLGNAITRDMNKKDLGRLGVFGDSGLLTVRIYDMQYDPTLVPKQVGSGSGEISPEELQLLPPHMSLLGEDDFDIKMTTLGPNRVNRKPYGLSANNAGAYLIRATLSITGTGGSSAQSWSVETSVIQSNMQ